MKTFLSGADYLQALRDTLAGATRVYAAVAFWGAGSDALFAGHPAPTRILCNLLSGGTNPAPIRGLQGLDFVEVKHSSQLHAKVLLTDRFAILGSANFSTNGLHYEGDELAGWVEAGVLTDDPDILQQAGAWFNGLWAACAPVGEADLRAAAAAWRRSRASRPAGPAPKPFDQLRRADLEGRPVHLALWSEPPSAAAEQAFEAVAADAARGGINTRPLDFYEGWPSLPKEAYLIDARIGPNGAIQVGKLYKRYSALDPSPDDASALQIVAGVRTPRGLPFAYDPAFRKALANRLRQMQPLLADGQTHRAMPLADAMP